MKFFYKLIFFFKKPKLVILAGKDRAVIKEILFKILEKHFKIGKELFIFEANQANLGRFYFFLKNSKLPILAVNDFPEPLFFENKKFPFQAYFVLNQDNEIAKKEIIGFDSFKLVKVGSSSKSEIFVSDTKVNGGTAFKINHKGSIVPFRFEKKLNQKQINLILFVTAIAIILGLNLVEIYQSFLSIVDQLDNDNKTN